VVDFPRNSEVPSRLNIYDFCQVRMSRGLLSEIGHYESFATDELYRIRVAQLAVSPRHYRYLVFELNWQNFIVDTMEFLAHRGDNYFNSLPVFFRVAFYNFNIDAHVTRLREINDFLAYYPSEIEGDRIKLLLAQFHLSYRENFSGWCTQINMVRICLASTWDFPLNHDNLGFAQPRIFDHQFDD
jgi:hypothetical protein